MASFSSHMASPGSPSPPILPSSLLVSVIFFYWCFFFLHITLFLLSLSPGHSHPRTPFLMRPSFFSKIECPELFDIFPPQLPFIVVPPSLLSCPDFFLESKGLFGIALLSFLAPLFVSFSYEVSYIGSLSLLL